MLTRELQALPPAGTRRRRLAAATLRSAAVALVRLARRLTQAQAARAEPVYEFYAEAGAPEGALYIDGQLVGTLPGVTRL